MLHQIKIIKFSSVSVVRFVRKKMNRKRKSSYLWEYILACDSVVVGQQKVTNDTPYESVVLSMRLFLLLLVARQGKILHLINLLSQVWRGVILESLKIFQTVSEIINKEFACEVWY